jgi:predicted acylesterase/phospholipase RssA
MTSSISRGLALSLSGSGSLFVYQLGACRSLVQSAVAIRSAVGSSGGAIAATVLAKAPNSIEEFVNDYTQGRGNGLDLLKDLLENSDETPICDELGICTTICRNGKSKIFHFQPSDRQQDKLLLQCVEASCRIPKTFHPWDVFSKHVTYPDEDGIWIEDDYYVDGGIAAPAPPTSTKPRLIISPVSGSSINSDRISPGDRSLTVGQLNAEVDFGTKLSWQNLQSISVSMGMASTAALRDWYQRGQDDASQYIKQTLQEG